MENKLKVEYKSIDKIVPYINNTKKHPQSQIDKIKASINEFGMCNPILIHNATIIAGHGRYESLKQLNIREVPTIDLSHLSEAQRKAYIIADNRIGEFGEWDEELLKIELQELKNSDLDFDIEEFEFDIELDDEFMSDLDESKADEVPEVDEDNIVIKKGDLIELGHNYQHRVLCGSATEKEDVVKLMSNELADQLVTDPPYNVAYEGKTKDALTIQNDDMDNDSFRQFLRDSFKNADMVMKEGGVFYIWHADSEGYNFRGACFDIGWKVRQCLIWNKNSMVMGRQDFHWKHEPCLYGWKDGAGHLWASDRKQTTILNFDRPIRNDLHPTMKPVELIEYCIENNTKGQDIVLDLFLGSGTTLIACENTGRRCRGTELDEKYAQVIIQRYVDYTSNPKIKINGVEIDWYEYKEKGE